MTQIGTAEFPFVNDLPKREKTAVQRLWDEFQELREIVREKGLFVPPIVAAELVGVSRQRLHQLVSEGRAEVVEFRGERFVTERWILAYAETERKAGRPVKMDEMTLGQGRRLMAAGLKAAPKRKK